MTIRVNIFLAFLGLVLLTSCDKDKGQVDYIPYVYVNQTLNLTNVQYAPLRQDRGFVYLANAGLRGIVVVRQSSNHYMAFERNCPYQPFDSCATVSMDPSGFFFKDPCCESQFDLKGAVLAGPAIYPLKQYATSLSGNMLYITN